MNTDQIESALRVLREAWPYQAISDTEARLWRRLLGRPEFDAESTSATLDLLIALETKGRPGPAEFADAARDVRRRRREQTQADEPQDHPYEPAPPEFAREAVAKIRDSLGRPRATETQ